MNYRIQFIRNDGTTGVGYLCDDGEIHIQTVDALGLVMSGSIRSFEVERIVEDDE